MSDPVLAQQRIEAIKEHTDPTYSRVEEAIAPDSEVMGVAGLLGVEKPSNQDRDKLAFIKHQFDTDNEADVLYQVREIERRLTPPRLGERRIDIVYNYLRAKAEANKAAKLRDSYLDGDTRT
jgi:hypothetical protein